MASLSDPCGQCGRDFTRTPNNPKQVYCSRACLYAWQRAHPEVFGARPKVTLTCSHCGAAYDVVASRVRGKVNHYCSERCMALHRSAALRAHPELLGDNAPRTRPCVHCGTPFTFKPKRIDTAKYCSRQCMLAVGILPDYHGEANPNYRHGQNQAAARLMALRWWDAKCVVCGWDTIVDVHHIVPKREGGTNTRENLVLLCPNHHRMADDGMLTRAALRTLTTAASLRRD